MQLIEERTATIMTSVDTKSLDKIDITKDEKQNVDISTTELLNGDLKTVNGKDIEDLKDISEENSNSVEENLVLKEDAIIENGQSLESDDSCTNISKEDSNEELSPETKKGSNETVTPDTEVESNEEETHNTKESSNEEVTPITEEGSHENITPDPIENSNEGVTLDTKESRFEEVTPETNGNDVSETESAVVDSMSADSNEKIIEIPKIPITNSEVVNNLEDSLLSNNDNDSESNCLETPSTEISESIKDHSEKLVDKDSLMEVEEKRINNFETGEAEKPSIDNGDVKSSTDSVVSKEESKTDESLNMSYSETVSEENNSPEKPAEVSEDKLMSDINETIVEFDKGIKSQDSHKENNKSIEVTDDLITDTSDSTNKVQKTLDDVVEVNNLDGDENIKVIDNSSNSNEKSEVCKVKCDNLDSEKGSDKAIIDEDCDVVLSTKADECTEKDAGQAESNTENTCEINTVDITDGEPEKTMDPTEKMEIIDDDKENDCVITEDPPQVIDCDEESQPLVETTETVTNEKPVETKDDGSEIQDEKKDSTPKSNICGLSNTLDILSDDEDMEPTKTETPNDKENTTLAQDSKTTEGKCINIEDDDDIMLIADEETTKEVKSDCKSEPAETKPDIDKGNVADTEVKEPMESPKIDEKPVVENITSEPIKPLVPKNFLKTFETNLAKMTRDELEEFCLLKIVEGIVDRTNLSDVKSKIKTLTQEIEEWKKKTQALNKQNRDLQIVVKAVQEEQKKRSDHLISPLRITRSVGMQVYLPDAAERTANNRRKIPNQATPPNRNNRNMATRGKVQPQNSGTIPVPRLVPATGTSPVKPVRNQQPQLQNSTVSSNTGKSPAQMNGVRQTPNANKTEKRPFSSVQSVTVDLTDDEPPAKQMNVQKNAIQSPVRLVPQQNILTPRALINQNMNSARKVFIPINAQASPSIRPGQTIMLKSVTSSSVRGRGPSLMRPISSTLRLTRPSRHPAPLPEVSKQQQPPNWKALPPAPDLKISKIENGIVISWKIEGYQDDSYESIASFQLYAYQETTAAPSTLLWKKVGDVRALPLPMACTLTQLMAGYKYYFAVRAIDNKSRIGPFSLPGSILLLNK